jgi:hypothetical protein
MIQEYAERPAQSCEHSCPFYNFSLINHQGIGAMIESPQEGNRCALIVDAHSPCVMEVAGTPIDYRSCPRISSVGMSVILRKLEKVRVFPRESRTAISIDEWVARFGITAG